MTFLSALIVSLVGVGIWTITEGVKAVGPNWRFMAIGSILLIMAFLISVGPISLGR